MGAFIKLNPDYIIREVDRDEGKFNLVHWVHEEQYELDDGQKRILELADGTKTEKEISNLLADEGIDSISAVTFIEEKTNEGLLKKVDAQQQREVVKELPRDCGAKHIRFVQWEMSAKCNQRCKHCYNENFITDNDLTTERCKGVIDELDQLNNLAIQISGGEPLLRNDLAELMDYIESKYMAIRTVFSNGIMLSKEMVEHMNSLKSCSSYIMSFDGPGEESYDFLRGKGQYQKLMRNLDNVNSLKQMVMLNVMLHRGNIGHVDDIFEFAKQHIPGTRCIRFGAPNRNYQGRYGETHDEIGISVEEELDAYKRLLKRYYDEGWNEKYDLELSNFFRTAMVSRGVMLYDEYEHPCKYVGGWTFTIKPTGDVQWCPTMYQSVYGNLRNESLVDIYTRKAFRDFAAVKMKDVTECGGCKYRKLCGSGCRAMVYDDIKKKDNLACMFMKYFEEEVIPLLPSQFQDRARSSITQD